MTAVPRSRHFVLITGPAGAGKTTILHRVQERLADLGIMCGAVERDTHARAASRPFMPPGSEAHRHAEHVSLRMVLNDVSALFVDHRYPIVLAETPINRSELWLVRNYLQKPNELNGRRTIGEPPIIHVVCILPSVYEIQQRRATRLEQRRSDPSQVNGEGVPFELVHLVAGAEAQMHEGHRLLAEAGMFDMVIAGDTVSTNVAVGQILTLMGARETARECASQVEPRVATM